MLRKSDESIEKIVSDICGLPRENIDEKQAIKRVREKLTASFGITDPVHISHISGYKTAEILPVFEQLERENKKIDLAIKELADLHNAEKIVFQ